MSRLILGIDPGTTESGICLIRPEKFDNPNIVYADKINNANLKQRIAATASHQNSDMDFEIVIEGMANQSRAFGQSSIETCYLIGRLLEFCDGLRPSVTVKLYKRHEYGRFFVSNGVLNDATLKAALETIFGASAKKTDPLYALRGGSDKRSAFALAKYHEQMLTLSVHTFYSI